ncbi:Crp/Fnr family transcriptional regulator [Acidisoma cellulosilyticum]|nr:Crp/Fnr family transcriptional regulator [Acidisoma cellulosilyticum]
MLRPRSILLMPQHEHDPCSSCAARGYSVCSAIDDKDLGRLAATAVVRDLAKGETFIEEGDSASDFFNVTRGTVKLYKLLPDGRQQVTGFAGAGHFLGLAVSNTYAFSAEAIEQSRVCRFSRPKLRELLHDFPALEERLLQTACNELVAAQEQMLLLGRKTARERVASFLVARLETGIPCVNPSDAIALPMTRGEIADYLGLTIETVSRTFSRFKAEKRIAIPSNTEVVILDRPWLSGIAAGLQ